MTGADPSRPHLALVGMMGVGKSTVGAACAAALDRAFVDTDDLVTEAAGRTIAAIFESEGEATFRAREATAVRAACAAPLPSVIACGGGVVLDAGNRRILRARATVVWLRAAAATLARRIGDGAPARPLLAGAPIEATLAHLLEARTSAYEQVAHHVLDVDGRTVDAVVADVLGFAR